MPRVTRSRKFAIAEDETALASQTPLPITPAKNSVALLEADILMTTNVFPILNDAAAAAEVKGLKAAYKSVLSAGRKLKKSNRVNQRKEQEFGSESTLVEEQGLGDLPVLQANTVLVPDAKESTTTIEELHTMAPQPTVRTTRHQLAKAQAAKEVWSKSLNEVNGNAAHDTRYEAAADTEGIQEPVVEETRSSHTPAASPVKTLEEVERIYGPEDSGHFVNDAGEDSFVQQITARSPAKPVSRIEDSVEALDQLEEALEALNQATQAGRMVSPEKSRQKARMPNGFLEGHRASKQPKVQITEKQQTLKKQPLKSGYATVRVKPAPKQAPALKKAASMNFKPTPGNAKSAEEQKVQAPAKTKVKRPMSLLPPKETVRSSKPPTRSTFELPGEAVALKLKEQREARIAQRQNSEDSSHAARVVSGPKIKSNKPPTKSTFELPGEELSRRKKAAHEARLKAQEEEERKRREFKARPIRNSVAPNMVPRETVASRARQSKIGTESIEDGNLTLSKRGSNIGAHRPSLAALNLANMSAPRAKGAFIPPVRKPSPNTAGAAATARPLQRAVSVTDADLRKRAKEIYKRDARLTEEMEREKRDREAAAKRAREEAAERGRQASREWAERQQAKKIAEGDKGMSAGYGPGGQLGLSHN
ncbi:hypothetical protein VTL71DRAFT_12753 [Oculimacula yallundae]|uniref:Carboxylesterase family protein n=1 Tax=Oculimacula yallundae TaxID=86028 RepID=A0ABR4CP73_9HELO